MPAPPATPPLPPVDPVITDPEFNAAIPSLAVPADPELDKPLESIDAFERRTAAEQTGAPPTAAIPTAAIPGVGAPANTGAATGPGPSSDAELRQPLPPLAQFQVEPVQLGTPENEGKEVQVRYAVKVNGLDAADKDTDTDLAAEFKGLSALRKGKGKAANLAMINARASEDGKLLKQILESEGWYSATVTTRIDRGAAPTDLGNDSDDKASRRAPKAKIVTAPAAATSARAAAAATDAQALTAVLDVAPGQRYAFSDIVVHAQPTIPPDLISKNIALQVGEPIVAARVQGAEAQLALVLPQNGYAFAKIGDRDIELDDTTGKGVYTLPVDTGPRGRFGDVATDGKLAFDAEHVQVLARFRKGDLYDSRKVDDLRQAMVATGLFSTIAVEPEKTGQSAGDDTEFVEMLVHQQAGPRHTIAGTAGYGSGQGFQLDATWTDRNKWPPEGALILHGIAGTKEQGAGAIFRRSNAGQRDRTFEFGVEALRTDYDAYTAKTGRLYVRMARDSTPIWQKRVTWAVGAQLLASNEKIFDLAAGEQVSKTYYIAGLSGQVGWDTSDSLLNPTRGFRVGTIIQPEGSLESGFTPYVRAQFDASGYYPFGQSLVVAGRVRFGTIQGASLEDLAPSRRFYAGGGGSVRGYAYQKLGPLDPTGDPIGGRSLTEGSAEVRYRFGNYGVVGFFDAGQAYGSTMPKFSNLRYGVGVGGRFYTNFGPFRLDVATPIARRAGEGRFNVYVSIGQAF